MSLMQLLTVGHSFSKPEADASRFRMARRGWLPRFGQAEEAPVEALVASRVNPGIKAEVPARVPSIDRYPRGRWSLPETPVAQLPEKPKVIIQKSSLMLDQVRVVRNDLADEDLELVPRRSSGPPAPARPVLAAGAGNAAAAGEARPWLGWFSRRMRQWLG